MKKKILLGLSILCVAFILSINIAITKNGNAMGTSLKVEGILSKAEAECLMGNWTIVYSPYNNTNYYCYTGGVWWCCYI